MARRAPIPCLILLPLLMQSCDETHKETETPPPASRPPRPPRPSPGPPITRAGLRDSLDRTLAEPLSEARDRSLETVIESSLELDPELAADAFNQLDPEGPVRQQLLGHFAMRLAEHDPDNATRWAAALKTDEERSLAFGGIALAVSSSDPEAAAKLLSDSGVASRDFDVAVVQVIQRWAAKSPAAAAAWVTRFDPGEARSAGLKELVSAWADDNATAAFDWIFSIQDPTTHAEAVNAMAEAILDRPGEDQANLLATAPKEVRLRHDQLKAEADGE